MFGRAVGHGRRNMVAYVALFFAISGGAFAATTVGTATQPTATRIFFSSNASSSNPRTVVLKRDGLVLAAKCNLVSGMPRLDVYAHTTVAGSDLEVPYSRAGETAAHDQTIGLDSVSRPLIPDSAPTNGTQIGGAFTYTTPAGASVTGNFQWWAGDTVKPLGGKAECLFSGVATAN